MVTLDPERGRNSRVPMRGGSAKAGPRLLALSKPALPCCVLEDREVGALLPFLTSSFHQRSFLLCSLQDVSKLQQACFFPPHYDSLRGGAIYRQHFQKAFGHSVLLHLVIYFNCHQVLITQVFCGSFLLVKNSRLPRWRERPRGKRTWRMRHHMERPRGKGLRHGSHASEAILTLQPSPAECSHMREPDGSLWNRDKPALLNLPEVLTQRIMSN